MVDEQHNKNADHATASSTETVNSGTDSIVAIDFVPNTNKAPRRTFRFRWFHGFLLCFFGIASVAGWFTLSAKSVLIDVNPITAEVVITDGISLRLGPRFLMLPGTYTLSLNNPGYHDVNTELEIGEQQSQEIPIAMRKLPGLVSISTESLEEVRVQLDGIDIGSSPLENFSMEPGTHELTLAKSRYLTRTETIEIEGREIEQHFDFPLDPAWAEVSFSSQPPNANVYVDGELLGLAPTTSEILQGEHEVLLKLAGYKAWETKINVTAGQPLVLNSGALEQANGLVFIRSTPSNANVTVNGEFKGQTPLEISLAPGDSHQLNLFKSGYHSRKSTVTTVPDEEKEINLVLEPELAVVNIIAEPVDAQLYVNGEFRGLANQQIELMAATQTLEIRKEGYVPYETEFTSRPGLEQIVRVSLKSEEQDRLDRIKPVITTAAGQTLKLFYPNSFTMGASRREAGRRPNEVIRDVILERPFYISLHEVTNGQYRTFKSEHSSGTLQGQTLDLESQPVVRVSWADAALYANWLSDQEDLTKFYQVADGVVTGSNPDAEGYRLPTEAEWAWVSRVNDASISESANSKREMKYSWGELLPPPDKAGNFADMSARSYLGEIVNDYNDGYLATAPVGSFTANHNGIYDLAGNVSEWVHDNYGSVGSSANEVDPLGPANSQYKTIRGSSWAHGSVTELRLSFRDFGDQPRDDVGFRLVRYLEEF